ncbi:MAG: hypothetical protein QOI58_3884 [Thermoanaerobaculia bacterium]|nr:hypothetical protein [Thermoanaerobaculia bacterium]
MPNCPRTPYRSRGLLPAELDHFEVAAFDRGKRRVEDVVVPARVVRSAHIQVAAVVGDDQAVGLHRLENAAYRFGIAGNVLRRFQAQARAHRQCAVRRSGAVRTRENVAVRVTNGDAKRVADRNAAVHLVVADQSRKDRQPRGVGARPALGTACVRIERERCAGACRPVRSGPVQRVELVQHPVVAIDEQHVPVAIGVRIVARQSAFDPLLLRLRLLGDRIARRTSRRGDVAFNVVVEGHGKQRLRAGDDDERHPVDRRRGIAAVAAEIGMHAAGRADVGDECAAVRIDRRRADVRVPPVAGRKERERLGKRAAALRRLREDCRGEEENENGKTGHETDSPRLPLNVCASCHSEAAVSE